MNPRIVPLLNELYEDGIEPKDYKHVAIIIASMSGNNPAIVPNRDAAPVAAPAVKKARIHRPRHLPPATTPNASLREQARVALAAGPKTAPELAQLLGKTTSEVHPVLRGIGAKPVDSIQDEDGHTFKRYGLAGTAPVAAEVAVT